VDRAWRTLAWRNRDALPLVEAGRGGKGAGGAASATGPGRRQMRTAPRRRGSGETSAARAAALRADAAPPRRPDRRAWSPGQGRKAPCCPRHGWPRSRGARSGGGRDGSGAAHLPPRPGARRR
jgi:hypothetical protein